MTVKFGTCGLSGLSGELAGGMPAGNATATARFMPYRHLGNPRDFLIIGRDFRDAVGAMGSIWTVTVRRSGLTPICRNAVATPTMANYALSTDTAAIRVTVFHIAADRNGIKFYRLNGEVRNSDEVQIVERARTRAMLISAQNADGGGAESRGDKSWVRFLRRNRRMFAPKLLSSLKAVVYRHGAVNRDFFADLSSDYGVEVLVLSRSEDFVASHIDVVLSKTCQWVRKRADRYRLDAIVSADGDRPRFVRAARVPVRGYLLLMLSAQFAEAKIIVTPFTSHPGIDTFKEFSVVRAKPALSYVLPVMARVRAAGSDRVIGSVANAGVVFSSNFALKGDMLTALPALGSALPILAGLNMAVTRKWSWVSSCFSCPEALSERLDNFARGKSAAMTAYLSTSPLNLRTLIWI